MIYFDFALCYNMIFHPDNEEELLYLGDKKTTKNREHSHFLFHHHVEKKTWHKCYKTWVKHTKKTNLASLRMKTKLENLVSNFSCLHPIPFTKRHTLINQIILKFKTNIFSTNIVTYTHVFIYTLQRYALQSLKIK